MCMYGTYIINRLSTNSPVMSGEHPVWSWPVMEITSGQVAWITKSVVGTFGERYVFLYAVNIYATMMTLLSSFSSFANNAS